jgi:phenylalanyl-tRNA synthetase beta chain
MRVRKGKDGWRVTPSSYRFDIEREVDLIEEIARVHGYENLPSKAPQILMCSSFKSECDIAHERFKLVLVDRDYQEVITYSFVDPELQSAIEPRFKPLMLVNPISADMAAMRVSLWPGLLQAIVYNANRQQERVRVFELGRSFVRRAETMAQDRMLAGAVTGPALPPQWGVKPRESDFFDVKRDVEALLQITGRVDSFDIRHGTHPALHPGQSAQISCQGNAIGWLGGLHPDLVAKLGLNRPVFLFELQVSTLQRGQIPQFGAISKFPAIRRDLALLVDVQTSAREVMATMRKAAGELLVDLQLFDEYRGEGIDSGRKSLALALTLQDSSRTLKDEVVEEILARVVRSLQSDLGAELRTK